MAGQESVTERSWRRHARSPSNRLAMAGRSHGGAKGHEGQACCLPSSATKAPVSLRLGFAPIKRPSQRCPAWRLTGPQREAARPRPAAPGAGCDGTDRLHMHQHRYEHRLEQMTAALATGADGTEPMRPTRQAARRGAELSRAGSSRSLLLPKTVTATTAAWSYVVHARAASDRSTGNAFWRRRAG